MTEQELLDRLETMDGQLHAFGLAIKSILKAHPEAGKSLRHHMDWGGFLHHFDDMSPVKRESFIRQVEQVLPK